jgi:hypothetical protein
MYNPDCIPHGQIPIHFTASLGLCGPYREVADEPGFDFGHANWKKIAVRRNSGVDLAK